MKEPIKMTKEQENLLAAISVNEEKVRRGELYGWQKEILKQYDQATMYLGKKYPAHQFVITWCEPADANGLYTVFDFQADGGSDTFMLYVDIEEDAYSCRDNFYGSLMKGSYEKAFLKALKEVVPECVGVSSSFTTVMGEDCDGTLSYEGILAEKKRIPNHTTIYAVAGRQENTESIAENIRNYVKGEKIYGGYGISILGELPKEHMEPEEIEEYLKDNAGACLYKESFQQFD